MHWVTGVILPHDWSDSRRILSCDWSGQVPRDDAVNITGSWPLLHTGPHTLAAPLAARHLAHLELGEGPVGGLGQVGDCQPVGLVGPQPLHSADHPVVVPGLGRLAHVLTGPLHMPLVPSLVLPRTHTRVSLKRKVICEHVILVYIILTHLLGSVQGVPLVNVVLAVDHPEDLVVCVDDAAGVVGLLPVCDGGVAQVKLVMTVQAGSVKKSTY